LSILKVPKVLAKSDSSHCGGVLVDAFEESADDLLFKTHATGATNIAKAAIMIQSSIAMRFVAIFPIILSVTKRPAIANTVIV